jgi:hypothetical protein
VILKKRNDDNKELEERYVVNIKNIVFPFMEKLSSKHLDEQRKAYFEIIQGKLNDFVSSLIRSLQQFNLTFMETKLASLIKNGKPTKGSAQINKSTDEAQSVDE